jgi:hypothetical protein
MTTNSRADLLRFIDRARSQEQLAETIDHAEKTAASALLLMDARACRERAEKMAEAENG